MNHTEENRLDAGILLRPLDLLIFLIADYSEKSYNIAVLFFWCFGASEIIL